MSSRDRRASDRIRTFPGGAWIRSSRGKRTCTATSRPDFTKRPALSGGSATRCSRGAVSVGTLIRMLAGEARRGAQSAPRRKLARTSRHAMTRAPRWWADRHPERSACPEGVQATSGGICTWLRCTRLGSLSEIDPKAVNHGLTRIPRGQTRTRCAPRDDSGSPPQ